MVGTSIGNILPCAANVDDFPFSWRGNILAMLFGIIKPFFLALPPEVSLDDEIAAMLQKDPDIFGRIITGIQTD